MYEVKTDRQVKYVPKSDEKETSFRHQREYLLQAGVGVLAHQQFRSRSLTDLLHKLGVSVDCSHILRIETQLAEAVLRHSVDHGIYVPPALAKGQFIYFAVDNFDFSQDTLRVKIFCILQQWPSLRGKRTTCLKSHWILARASNLNLYQLAPSIDRTVAVSCPK